MPIQIGDTPEYLSVASVDAHSAAEGDKLVYIFDIKGEFESAPHPDDIDRLYSLFKTLSLPSGHVNGVRVVRVNVADLP